MDTGLIILVTVLPIVLLATVIIACLSNKIDGNK